MNAGGVLGRIAPAYLADKVGRFNLLVPSAFLSGLSCLVFWFFAKSLVAVMMFSVVYGFLSGSFVSVINPCVAQISHMSQMGTRIGLLYSIISIPWVFIHSFIYLSLSFLFFPKELLFSPGNLPSFLTARGCCDYLDKCVKIKLFYNYLRIMSLTHSLYYFYFLFPDLLLEDLQQAHYSLEIMVLTISWFFSAVQPWYLDLSSF